MKIDSPEFGQNEAIPSRFTCDGEDVAPPLRITGIPANAKTLAVVVDDPDASGGTWTHWTVWNVPASPTVELGEELPDDAVLGVTSFGTRGYGGPCPPSGRHRYFFKAYALDTVLELPAETLASELERLIAPHVVDKAGLIGVYERG